MRKSRLVTYLDRVFQFWFANLAAILPGATQAGHFARPFQIRNRRRIHALLCSLSSLRRKGLDVPGRRQMLAMLDARSPIEGVEVIVLEHHVNYWDDQAGATPFLRPRPPAPTEVRFRAPWYRRSGLHAANDRGWRSAVQRQYGSLAQHAIEQAAKAPKTPIQWLSGTPRKPSGLARADASLDGAKPGDKPEVFLAINREPIAFNVRRGETPASPRSLRRRGANSFPSAT